MDDTGVILKLAGTACLGIPLLFFLFIVLFPRDSRLPARVFSCLNNLRQIDLNVIMYSQDHDNRFPQGEIVWNSLSLDRYKCPFALKQRPPAQISYGYNSLLVGKTVAELTAAPSQTVVVADGGNAQHLLTMPADIDRMRHNETYGFLFKRREYFCYAAYDDGHVDTLHADNAVRLQR